jgi:hypothetical protein
MQTPHKLSIKEFANQRQQWIKDHCVTDGEYQRCRTCNTKVEIVGVYFSIHDARLDICAGAGKVMRLAVPFCPRCESQPEDHSCLHHSCLHEFPILVNPATAFNN